jgi:hypothetical protein
LPRGGIRFTVPVFTDPEHVLFRTRLEGFVSEWTPPSFERQMLYPRLPHIALSLPLSACYPDGGWRASSETVSFAVLPFFWKTAWFGVFAGVVVLGNRRTLVGFFIKRARVAQAGKGTAFGFGTGREMAREQAVQRERARIARDIHDDSGPV